MENGDIDLEAPLVNAPAVNGDAGEADHFNPLNVRQNTLSIVRRQRLEDVNIRNQNREITG